jgi:hypothetical protein
MAGNKKALIVENGHLAGRALLSPYCADYLKYFKFRPKQFRNQNRTNCDSKLQRKVVKVKDAVYYHL